MDGIFEFVARNGYWVVFLGVFSEQLGVPLPTPLLLLAAGALAGLGQLDFVSIILLTIIAALIGDVIWFYIGRRRGFQVLNFLCRISLEQDSCVSGAKGVFARHGERSLLVSKFIPGFSTFAQPLAGATGMNLGRFLMFDGLGALIWAGVFVSLGYIFSDRFEQVAGYAESFSGWFGVGLVAVLLIYVVWKFAGRRRLIRSLRVTRISPEELKNQLDSGEDVLILDLRDPLDFEANPQLIPTARRMPPAELEARHEELPRDCDVILYCTCPNEATSARAALRLHRRGITRVRPLHGGLQKWNELKFPTDSYN
jgi:membrane protein DedA with SNARE-associated domain/rhodanese-related sulfurtransferase